MPTEEPKKRRRIFYLVLFSSAVFFAVCKSPASAYLSRFDLVSRYLAAPPAMKELIYLIAEDRLTAFSTVWDNSRGVLLSKKMFRPLTMDGQKRYSYRPHLKKLSFKTGTEDFQRYFEAFDTPRLRNVLKKLETSFLMESSFNEYGFRKTDYEDQSRCSETVLFAGDSFTEGLWTAQNKIFANLYGKLAAEHGKPVCVFNSGTNGYGILEESYTARSVYSKIHFQTIFLMVYLNDIDPDAFAVLRGDLPDLEARWKEYAAELKKLADFAQAHQIHVFLVAIPPKDQFDMPNTRVQYQERLAGLSSTMGFFFLDPYDLFAGRTLEEIYLDWDPHFNESGHRLMAEFLVRNSQLGKENA